MENCGNEARGPTEDGGREQDPERLEVASDDPQFGEDDRSLKVAASRGTGVQGSASKRDVPSWINWQSALYVFVLGWICILLAPLTNFWWLALVCGMATPIALAALDRPDDGKVKERELLDALAERGELTPTTAVMRTSLTVDEASKILEGLARKGYLELRVEDGALRERRESESEGAPLRLGAQQLDDPLSERELEVLALLASGRTNAEIARDLFVAVGTVKSHTGNIYRKLGAKNRAEALARSRELELLG